MRIAKMLSAMKYACAVHQNAGWVDAGALKAHKSARPSASGRYAAVHAKRIQTSSER
jgi:hypothetical protein